MNPFADTLQTIVTFHTTTDAFVFQELCTKAGIPGKLRSIPRRLSAGCGMAWYSDAVHHDALDELCQANNFDYEQFCDMVC